LLLPAQVLPLLQARFPIQRARMRLKLQVPLHHQQQLLALLDAAGSAVEDIDATTGGGGGGASCSVVVQVRPRLVAAGCCEAASGRQP
jgi:ribosome maturation protein SDO1